MEVPTKSIRKEKEKAYAAVDSDNRHTERTPCNFFRCGSEYNLIAKFPNPPKDNEKQIKQDRFSERVNHASQK